MGKINSAQRAALEAAGYTISKSGKTVLTSEGKSIGGYNENGQIFSGSSKVRDILKNTKEAPAKAAEAPAKTASAKAAPAKAAPKAAEEKPMRPKARPAAKPAEGGKGGGGADKMPATGVTAPKKYSGRGDGASEVSRRATDSARKAKEDMQDKTKKVVAGAVAASAAALGARAALKSPPKAPRKPATPTVTNPTYSARSGMKTGFQGKYETGVGRPGMDARRGLAGNAAPFERVAGGGGRASMENKDDKLPMFNKGGMVKKGKK